MFVVRGGKGLAPQTEQSRRAGLTEEQWRAGVGVSPPVPDRRREKDKAWGNETVRWHPGEGWLEVKLPAPLAHLANRPPAGTAVVPRCFRLPG